MRPLIARVTSTLPGSVPVALPLSVSLLLLALSNCRWAVSLTAVAPDASAALHWRANAAAISDPAAIPHAFGSVFDLLGIFCSVCGSGDYGAGGDRWGHEREQVG